MKNDELDAATVERCAQVAERAVERNESLRKKYANTCDGTYYLWCRQEAESIASAIRSLIPNSANDHSSDGGATRTLVRKLVDDPNSASGKSLQYVEVTQDCAPAGTVSDVEMLGESIWNEAPDHTLTRVDAYAIARALFSQFDIRRK